MNIESYSYGQLTVDGKVYERDLIVFPEKISSNWSRLQEDEVSAADLREVLDYQPQLLIVGQGDSPVMSLTEDARQALERQRIEWVERDTAEATQLFNEYLQSRKRVVAAFHLSA